MAYQTEFGPGSSRMRGVAGSPPAARAEPIHPRDLDLHPARRPVSSYPEIDCIRRRLPPGLIAAAEQRAAAVGVGADRVLITWGAISEDAYIRAFAAWYGLAFEDLDGRARHACPVADDRLVESAAAGLLPIVADGTLALVVAPRGLSARRIADALGRQTSLRQRIRLTTTERLHTFAHRHGATAIGVQATNTVRLAYPELSAAERMPRSRWIAPLALAAGAIAIAPDITGAVANTLLALGFLAWTGLRLLGAALPFGLKRRTARLPDNRLPIYSLIIALYDEAAAVPGLIAALRRLDYPPEKLDIKLVLEPNDQATRSAFEGIAPGAPFEIIIAPDYGPRTKPKALNAALPFARGTFVGVYDAEDRPDPDQLRIALNEFLNSGEEIACVQAALTIDNTEDSWLARLFTAEYAGLFDVFLPGLARQHLPLPLGGSSNHFRTSVLRKIGGWDPYNVTEDADLGMRLARFGYRTKLISSTTYEEAPARFMPWLKQRTRWFKGWMQTWLVHMRQPLGLARDLGPAGFAAFQLVVGGSVLSALVHPIFLAWLIYDIASGAFPPPSDSVFTATLTAIYGGALLSGYVTSGVLAAMGLARRKLLGSAWVVLLMPVHWILLSLAAWRALFQLIRDPYSWEKTAHGLARSSRRLARSDGNRAHPAARPHDAPAPRRR